ncbi:hypothetical protein BDV95DRAFT_503183 [Massariosphaeria phaeospora]|uniref:Uncharacterized protein n=1 Tax=Massariosphaeria phaeospora TaxID=100035 RepID=A0A7C8M4G1_9PLEO|nr:hypothetical protein BDV95DRAFT_503183 [Massariosphaeria phaeospora]
MLRIFGASEATNRIMRRIYLDELAKLKNNSFKNEKAKIDWQEFVKTLTLENLTLVTAKD